MKKEQSEQRTILGLTLSRRGWNNALIYSVLIMMFVLYFLNHDRGRIAGDESFKPFAVYNIVELRDASHDLVRVGNQWELRSGQLTSDEQHRWLDAWQNLAVQPYEGLLAGQEYSVMVSVADQEREMQVTVFFDNDRIMVALPGYDTVFLAVHKQAADLRPAR